MASLSDLVERGSSSIETAVLWIDSHAVWFKSALGIVFLAGMWYASNYAAVVATAFVTGVIYLLLVFLFYYRDRKHFRKAPGSRVRYFLGLPAIDCLICHEDVRDPVLLSCGHIYCASCIAPLIKEVITECAYCGQTLSAAHDMRLERIAIMQLALNITQSLDLGLKCYVGGLYGFIASVKEAYGALEVVLGLPLHCYFNGREYWWKGSTDHKKREDRRNQLPEGLRWGQEVFDQMKVGWNWRALMYALPIAVSWSLMWALIEDHEKLQRQRAAASRCERVCMCGGIPVDSSHCML